MCVCESCLPQKIGDEVSNVLCVILEPSLNTCGCGCECLVLEQSLMSEYSSIDIFGEYVQRASVTEF